jgi:hypothetical protein
VKHPMNPRRSGNTCLGPKYMWHNPYLPMTVWFEPSPIGAPLQYVSRLHAAEPGVDHSRRVWEFMTRFPRLSN